MSSIAFTVPIGVGDLIYLRGLLDTVKHRYSSIKIKFHKELIGANFLDGAYHQYLDDMGKLLFSESPYVITDEPGIPYYDMPSICNAVGAEPVKPNLAYLLCKGEPLDLDDEYIVISTKVRYLNITLLNEKTTPLWQAINALTSKYKIVILGEREIDMTPEYQAHNSQGFSIYSIYQKIIDNVPAAHIIDKSIPVLGRVAPRVAQIQQDCLIMNRAKFVISLGVGGGLSMATSVANTVCFRADSDIIADAVFDRRTYPDAVVTKDWDLFIRTLQQYST
jgi:hypothetical protein